MTDSCCQISAIIKDTDKTDEAESPKAVKLQQNAFSKQKAKRKTTNHKNRGDRRIPIIDSEVSCQKQAKLTSFWKNQIISSCQSITKSNVMNQESLENKTREQLEQKKKIIQKMSKQKQNLIKKYRNLQQAKNSYQEKSKKIIQALLVQNATKKRLQRQKLNYYMGHFIFKPSKNPNQSKESFINGPYIIDYQTKIREKQKQIQSLKLATKVSKDSHYVFKLDFCKKQLVEMNKELQKRQKQVLEYQSQLKFAQKERSCKYAKQNWCVLNKQYQVLELIGFGGFGQVYKCFDYSLNQYVALKVNFIPANSSISEYYMRHLQRQIQILQKLNHINIAKLIQIIQINDKQVSFMMQYCQGPELSKYLRKYQYLQEKQAKQIIHQVLAALKYLYEQQNKIIHYDLKPSNIIFHHGIVKILDFGLCKQMESDQTKIQLTSAGTGTYWYLPPQTFIDEQQQVQISPKVDVWSVGVIFYELLYGIKPFGHRVNQKKFLQQKVIKSAKQLKFPTNDHFKVSEEAKQFIRGCLKYKASDRLNSKQAYQHRYFYQK